MVRIHIPELSIAVRGYIGTERVQLPAGAYWASDLEHEQHPDGGNEVSCRFLIAADGAPTVYFVPVADYPQLEEASMPSLDTWPFLPAQAIG